MNHRNPPLPFLLAPALVALAGAGHAQSTSDFRLQPGAQPRAQGPVDANDPALPAAPVPAVPRASTPAAAPAPSPTPTLVIPAPPAPSVANGATKARTANPPVPPEGRTARAAPIPASPAPLGPAPATQAEPSLATPTALPAPAPVVPTAAGAGSAAVGGLVAWWWLLPAALLGALGSWIALIRRRTPESPEFVRPQTLVAGRARPEPGEAPPVPGRGPAAPAPAAPAPQADPLDLTLEPVRFSVSLVNATLTYRLVLGNRSAAPLGPVHIAADMIAAHASLPEEVQLGLDGAGLELRHEVAGIAPGEAVALTGDLRLPLAAITPILAGGAALLVPLVRLRVDGAGPTRTTALVVGEPPASPGGPLRPFRLDQGPRTIAAVGQRALATAA